MTPPATALATASGTAPAPASAEYRADVAGSRAANTIKAYTAWAARFDAWRGQEPAQAVADVELAAYLRALESEGKAPASIAQAAPYGRGTESPVRQEIRSRRDAAMLGLLFYAGMRRSEAAAVTAADVQAAADAPGCALVAVRRSKTNPDCSEASLLGIGPDQIANRVKALAKAAGTEGRITAHSGRIGLASELTRRGASTTETMLAGGWKTARMVAHYSAGATAAETGGCRGANGPAVHMAPVTSCASLAGNGARSAPSCHRRRAAR